MKPIISIFIFCSIFAPLIANAQKKCKLTSDENAAVLLFNKFMAHYKQRLTYIKSLPVIISSSNDDANTKNKNDSLEALIKKNERAHFDLVYKDFVLLFDNSGMFSDSMLLQKARRELDDLYTYFDRYNPDSLELKPIRLQRDVNSIHVYHKLNNYQKQNTFVLKHMKHPDVILNYFFFFNSATLNSNSPKLFSWKLAYTYGHYYFIDVLGNLGTEAIFYKWEN